MRKNLGPQARVKAVAEETRDTLLRLPRIVANIEETLQDVSQNGLKLDTGRNRTGYSGFTGWLGWVVALGLGATLLIDLLT
jgi:ubiquinone biosynthesis protein